MRFWNLYNLSLMIMSLIVQLVMADIVKKFWKRLRQTGNYLRLTRIRNHCYAPSNICIRSRTELRLCGEIFPSWKKLSRKIRLVKLREFCLIWVGPVRNSPSAVEDSVF